MFCTNCGVELRDSDRFCCRCGKPAGAEPPGVFRPPGQRLSLPLEGRKIAGVCAGFARYLGLDVTLIRILWLVLALWGGIGLIAYLIAWLLMPKDSPVAPAATAAVAQQGA